MATDLADDYARLLERVLRDDATVPQQSRVGVAGRRVLVAAIRRLRGDVGLPQARSLVETHLVKAAGQVNRIPEVC